MGIVIIISMMAMFCGVALIRKGLRGRVVDNHPLCGACGFDLHRLVEVAETQSDACWCPECGADVATPVTRTVGNRERSMWRVQGGAALACVALLFMSAVGFIVIRGVDPIQYTPLSWVLDRATSERLEKRSYAWDIPRAARNQEELARRISAGSLSSAQIERIVDNAMEVLQNGERPMNRWVEVVDAAAAQGVVPEAGSFDWLFAQATTIEGENEKLAIHGHITETMYAQQLVSERLTSFDPQQVEVLVEYALAKQLRVDEPIEYWGSVFEAAMDASRTTDEQITRYLSQLFQFEFVVRSPIGEGDPHPFELQADWRGRKEPAGWMNSREAQYLSYRFERLTLGGKPIEIPNWSDRELDRRLAGSVGDRRWAWWGLQSVNSHPGVYEQVELAPGRHTLSGELRYWFNGSEQSALSQDDIRRFGCQDGWTVHLEQEILVEPRTQSVVSGVKADPALVRRVLKDGDSHARLSRVLAISIAWRQGYLINEIPKAPVDLALEVLVRIEGVDYPVGSVEISKGWFLSNEVLLSTTLGPIVSDWLDRTGARELEIVFRPSMDVAKRTLDQHEVWDGPDVVISVPLEDRRSSQDFRGP